VLGVDSAIVEESLMLVHAFLKRNVIVLAPATKRVKQEDGVLVALLDELFTGVVEQEAVTIVEGVANLEGVNGISILGLDQFRDFGRSVSVLVHAVVEGNALNKGHGRSRHEPWALGHDGLSTGVFARESTEDTGADFFLAVLEEDGLVNNSVAFILVPDSEFLNTRKSFLLFFSSVHGHRA
jgi:hypothetical protein